MSLDNDFQSIVIVSNQNNVITLIIMPNIGKIVVTDQVSLRGRGNLVVFQGLQLLCKSLKLNLTIYFLKIYFVLNILVPNMGLLLLFSRIQGRF